MTEQKTMTTEAGMTEVDQRPALAAGPDRLADNDAAGASLDDALQLAELSGSERRGYLEQNPGLQQPQVIVSFCRRAAGLLRTDLPLARRMVDAAGCVAEALGDPVSSARAERARAQLHHIEADYQAALDGYTRSVLHYEDAGEDVQAAITRSCALHVLALLGRFEMADDWANQSRELFSRMGDRVRLARLDANVAVVLHRRHEFEEALQLSLRAFERLRAQGTSQDVAVTLRNMLVCHVGLRNVALAMDVFDRARSFSDRHRFPRLVLEADYNIAYVYQMRGEHDQAIELYESVRKGFKDWGDPFHEALCDLDQSEVCLEKNDLDTAERLAKRSLAALERLEVGLESGRSLIHLAIVAASRSESKESLELLDRADALFVSSGDPVWSRLTGFYRALVLDHEGQTRRALELASQIAIEAETDSNVARRALFGTLRSYLVTRSEGSELAQEASCRALLELTAIGGVPKMPSPCWLQSPETAAERLVAIG